MNCKIFRNNALAYTEKELPVPLMEELFVHESECTECAHLVSEFRKISALMQEETIIEPLPFAETRLQTAVNSYLEKKNKFSLNSSIIRLQPVLVSFVIILAIALGILIGQKDRKYTTADQLSNQQIESMRLDLNVPGFMDEDNFSLN